MEQRVVELICNQNSPDLATQQAAIRELEAFIAMPQSIGTFMNVAMQGGVDIRIRSNAVVILQRNVTNWIRYQLADFNAIAAGFRAAMLQLLVQETDYDFRRAVADVINIIGPSQLLLDGWKDLCDFLVARLESDTAICFRILSEVLKDLPGPLVDGWMETLLPGCLTCLNSQDDAIRENSTNAFIPIVELLDDSAVIRNPAVFQALSTALMTAVASGNNERVTDITYLIAQLWNPWYDMGRDLIPFVSVVFELIRNKEINPEIRVILYQIIIGTDYEDIESHSLERYGAIDVIEDNNIIMGILNATLDLTLEVCSYDRSSTDFYFGGAFIEAASEKGFLPYILEFVQKLLSTPSEVTVQVALYLLDCIIEPNSNVICEFEDSLVATIMNALKISDDDIAESTNLLLDETYNVRPDCMNGLLDDLVRIYLDRPTVYETLEHILASSNRVTGALDDVLQRMMAILGDGNLAQLHEMAIRCIAAALSKCRTVNDAYFDPLMGSGIATNESLRGAVLSLVSSLIKVSPNPAKANIGTILGMIASSISPLDFGVNRLAVNCLRQLFTHFFQTVSGSSEEIFAMLKGIYEMDGPDKYAVHAVQGDTLIAMAYFVRCFQTHADEVMMLIFNAMEGDLENDAYLAASVICEFMSDKERLTGSSDIPISVLIDITQDVGITGPEHLKNILEKSLQCDPKYMSDVLRVVGTGVPPQVVPNILGYLAQYAECPLEEVQTHAMRAMATFSLRSGNEGGFAAAMPIITSKLESNKRSIVEIALTAFREIIDINPAVIQGVLPAIAQVAQQKLTEKIPSVAYCEAASIIMTINNDLTAENIREIYSVLETIEIPCLLSILQSTFKFYEKYGDAIMEQLLMISVRAVTAPNMIWMSVPDPIKAAIKQLVGAAGPDRIAPLIQCSEYWFTRITQRCQ